VDQRKTDVRQVSGFGAAGDDAARFLRELRQLRDGAGLGQAELAARAHYPYDSIKAAEVGPALPELPVLAAYVKGCGGTTEEWEERWRSLTRSPSLPLQTTRSAGNSPAATAGARIGSAAQDAESPDPAVIIAALNRVADDMASGSDPLPEPDDTPSWPVLPAEGSPAATATAGEDEPRSDGLPAGWDPIRVSTAWPVLPPSASRTEFDGEAGRPSAASRESLPRKSAPRKSAVSESALSESGLSESALSESAPWESAPWDTAPWAGEPASAWGERAVGGEADLGATQQVGAGTAGANGAGTLGAGANGAGAAGAGANGAGAAGAGTVRTGKGGADASRAASQVTVAAASGAAQGPARIPARTAVGAGGAAGQPAGSSRTRLLVVSAVLLCVIAVLLAVFI
jgi:hypothetical protein